MSTYLESTPRARANPRSQSPKRQSADLPESAVLVITVAPFIGLLFAVWSLWGWGLSGVDAGIFLATYILSGLGVTVGFHRLLTHKSFETKPWLQSLLAIAGSLAIEGSVISWVAAHRRHHAFSDREGGSSLASSGRGRFLPGRHQRVMARTDGLVVHCRRDVVGAVGAGHAARPGDGEDSIGGSPSGSCCPSSSFRLVWDSP